MRLLRRTTILGCPANEALMNVEWAPILPYLFVEKVCGERLIWLLDQDL